MPQLHTTLRSDRNAFYCDSTSRRPRQWLPNDLIAIMMQRTSYLAYRTQRWRQRVGFASEGFDNASFLGRPKYAHAERDWNELAVQVTGVLPHDTKLLLVKFGVGTLAHSHPSRPIRIRARLCQYLADAYLRLLRAI